MENHHRRDFKRWTLAWWRVKIGIIMQGVSERPKNVILSGSKNIIREGRSIFHDGYDPVTKRFWNECFMKNQLSIKDLIPCSIKFDTQEITENFVKSCNYNFFWNLMYMIKWDANVPLRFLPWMEDYTKV